MSTAHWARPQCARCIAGLCAWSTVCAPSKGSTCIVCFHSLVTLWQKRDDDKMPGGQIAQKQTRVLVYIYLANNNEINLNVLITKTFGIAESCVLLYICFRNKGSSSILKCLPDVKCIGTSTANLAEVSNKMVMPASWHQLCWLCDKCQRSEECRWSVVRNSSVNFSQ